MKLKKMLKFEKNWNITLKQRKTMKNNEKFSIIR